METDTSEEHISNDESVNEQNKLNDRTNLRETNRDGNNVSKDIEPVIDKFISDHRPALIPTATVTREQLGIDNQPQPSTSGWHRTRDHRGDDRWHDDRRVSTHNERAAEVIQEAEAAKVRIFDLQGRLIELN